MLQNRISAAYAQILWRVARTKATSCAPNLDNLNTIYAVFYDAPAFLKVQTWWKYPIFGLVAALSLVR